MNHQKSPIQRAIVGALVAALSLGSAGFASAQRHDDDHHDRDRHDNHEQMRRGAGPDHSYYVGHRMPPQYRSRQYVVDDWRGHHLRQPPRGYHWVQSGSDYLLVAVATGLITSAILNN